MNDGWMVMVLALPLAVIIGGIVTTALAMQNQARLKELKIRERIAMIERGMMPPPGVDPAVVGRRRDEADVPLAPPITSSKYLSAGVILVGVGLGLTLLIWLTSGEPAIGIGVGGAVVLLGAALLVNAMLDSRRVAPPMDRYRPRAPMDRGTGPDSDTGAPDLP